MHLSVDKYWGCFHFLLLWIILQWALEFRYLFEIVISFPLNIYSEMELLNDMVGFFCRASILFSIVAVTVYIPTNTVHKTRSLFCKLQPRCFFCYQMISHWMPHSESLKGFHMRSRKRERMSDLLRRMPKVCLLKSRWQICSWPTVF